MGSKPTDFRTMFGGCPTPHTVSSIVAHSPFPARPHTLVDTCSAVCLAASYALLPRFMASADNQTTKDESKTEQPQGVLITIVVANAQLGVSLFRSSHTRPASLSSEIGLA